MGFANLDLLLAADFLRSDQNPGALQLQKAVKI
jgi:hypothetical protein